MHMPGEMPGNQIFLGDKEIQQPILIYFMSKTGIKNQMQLLLSTVVKLSQHNEISRVGSHEKI